MPRRRDDRKRVLGPYNRGDEWRIIVVDPGESDPRRRRITRDFAGPGAEETAVKAREKVEAGWAEIEARTVDDAITEYGHYQERKGNLPTSVKETARRLRVFFPKLDRAVGELGESECAGYYDQLTQRVISIPGRRKRRNRPKDKTTAPSTRLVSVETHRNYLIEARSFLRWCKKMKWIAWNPLDNVEGVGKRLTGKTQLTGDEARQWYATALELASGGDEGALGCLLALTMALRQKDLLQRVVRDVDLDGTVLRVDRGKTKKSNRPRHIPVALQPLVRKLVEGCSPLQPLFRTPPTEETPGGGFHTHSWLRCAAHRIATKAGTPYVCPHGLKGTAGSILAETGELADRIADHLSHESASTSKRHYIQPGALEEAQQQRGLALIQGGKK
jgi:integrase